MILEQFCLNKDVSRHNSVSEKDMIPLKTKLSQFGAYTTPNYGMTEYPDDELFEGIKMYQRKNGLNVDGVMKKNGETLSSMNKELAKHKPAYLKFNGKELSWNEENKPIRSWRGMSGQPDYQCKKYIPESYKGPLPEGKWLVKQSQYQKYDDLSFGEKIANHTSFISEKVRNKPSGKWKGGTAAWGKHRIWLEPADGTDNKNRTNLSIHGGESLGSGGCVDLADKMEDFIEYFKKYGSDMILDVKYDQECW